MRQGKEDEKFNSRGLFETLTLMLPVTKVKHLYLSLIYKQH